MLYFIGLLTVVGVAAFALGPRPVTDTNIEFDEASLPEDLNAYVAQSEAQVTDLRPGNERQIIWAYPASKARTPLAIVYIHGFSASPGETRPFADLIAAQLGANFYYVRLKGHGRSGDAMIEGSVHGWANDFAEAMAIGRRLGERVVIVGDIDRSIACRLGRIATGIGARCRWAGADFTKLWCPGRRFEFADHAMGRKDGAVDTWATPLV
ncbi:Alpha/beta hydrolase family [Hoeflea sp. IMCC20628]|uniref:alpha/beta hydrolase n=1 Tax=Hoeflea sp. IMCC20628 TaxID=1620421 RepID=UPI00063BD6F2|nr:hypothetical protein [Hoeflea sp. IMCC20628]AKI00441.1 Alpha/beta hydrolase family [Hoeflea sp. IMCC20628]